MARVSYTSNMPGSDIGDPLGPFPTGVDCGAGEEEHEAQVLAVALDRGPKHRTNVRILHPGFKAQCRGDTRNHVL